ncbi:MAG: hypothetical protein KBS76_02175, partial [Ruminococcus sp.]|nr:hypothetical protein [Candidatus Apopatosoma intestinale]
GAVLALTGSSAYVVRVNGRFAAFGPARSAHGFYRVDEIPLDGLCQNEKNVVTVTVAGYNANSFYHLNQPSFLCAEVRENGTVTAATGWDGFVCRVCDEHEEKALRYSFQRTFCETYNMTPELAEWETEPEIGNVFPTVTLEKTEGKTFIARGCALNVYETIPAETLLSRETFAFGDHRSDFLYPYWIRRPAHPTYKHFETADVTSDTALLARNLDILSSVSENRAPGNEALAAGEALTYSFGREYTGEVCLSISCDEDSEVFITFDEYLSEGNKINYRRMSCNCLLWRLKKGDYVLSTFEPYSLSVLRLFALKGRFTVTDVSLRFFGAEATGRRYTGRDPDLQKIFDAAVQTYRQNTFTIYMDCPSRERAGWLCDSFFTSRVEKVLTGKSEVEHNFLENFFLPDTFRDVPKGMFPMCYPGDHNDGNFIPNWAMFLVLELEEYVGRTGDRTFAIEAKDKVYGLLDYFKPFENTDGLLEKLEKWVFVEWSESNKLTQDVNYPTNMLYAKTLRAVASLYGDPALSEKADRLCRVINEQSFTDHGFYCDNAVYGEDGRAHLSGKFTESCQYYAFFCDVATPETRPELWERLLHDFGPGRVIPRDWPNLKADAKWPEVYPANAFIGNYLRLELLWRYGEHEKLIENIKGYFVKMAEQTGTLWENEMDSASCNHGFASHVLYWMDGLGLIQ